MDDVNIEILSRAVRVYAEWANKTIPGFFILLSSIQDELNADSIEDIVRKAISDPKNFYESLMKLVGSSVVADSYMYLLISSFIDFFKLPINASDAIKVLRKGKWEELMKKIMDVTKMLSGKV